MEALDAYGARLLGAVPIADDPVARELTLHAITAFVAARGDVVSAVRAVDFLVRRVGAHHGRLGTRPEEFALIFAIAHRAALDGLPASFSRRRVSEYVATLAASATAALLSARRR